MTIELQYLTPAGEVWRRSVITLDVLAEAMRLARLEDEEVDVTTVEHDSWGNTVMVEDEAADALEMSGTFRERVELELDVLSGALDDFDANSEQLDPKAVCGLAAVLESTASVLRKAAAREAHTNGRTNQAGTHFGRVAGRNHRAGDSGSAAADEDAGGAGSGA